MSQEHSNTYDIRLFGETCSWFVAFEVPLSKWQEKGGCTSNLLEGHSGALPDPLSSVITKLEATEGFGSLE